MRNEQEFAKDVYDVITRSQSIFHEHNAEIALVFLIDHLSDVCEEHELFLEGDDEFDEDDTEDGILFDPKHPVCNMCKKRLDGEVPKDIMREVEEETAKWGDGCAYFVCEKCHNALEARSEHKAKYN